MLFGGWNAFTVIMNYVLLLAIGIVIWREYRNAYPANKNLSSHMLTAGLCAGFLFSWGQHENLTWGFQSQFIAVHLFSFIAFAIYSRCQNPLFRIVWSILFSVLAGISMGNGMAAFAVLVGQGILLRRPWKEMIAIIMAMVIFIAIYFYDYTKVAIYFDPSMLGVNVGWIKLKDFFIFFANPVYPFVRFLGSEISLSLCAVIGVCYFFIALRIIMLLFVRHQVTAYRSFLSAIIGMVIVSAAAAANWRWMQGVEATTAGRYSTPVLLGYIALALLVLDIAESHWARFTAQLVPLIALTIFAKSQFQIFGNPSHLYDWKLAALGQKIGLDHPAYDALIYPATGHDALIQKYQLITAENIGPWGRDWLHDAGIVKFDPERVDPKLCNGFIDHQTTDDIGLVASGWAMAYRPFKQIFRRAALLIVLVDANGQTAGYGVTGQYRPDVAAAYKNNNAPDDSGWTGFAKRDSVQPLHAYAYVGGNFCLLHGQ